MKKSINKFKETNKNILVLLKASFIASFSIGLLMPIYAIFVQKIGGSILDVGIAYSIFCILTGLFIIFVGRSRYFSRHIRGMVVLGYFLVSIGNFSYLLVYNPMTLFMSQIILGIANGILEPSWDSVFSAYQSIKQESRHWATWSGGANIMIGISSLIGSFIVVYFSFKILFLLMGILTFISGIIALRLLSKE
jgi:hypothetical protein